MKAEALEIILNSVERDIASDFNPRRIRCLEYLKGICTYLMAKPVRFLFPDEKGTFSKEVMLHEWMHPEDPQFITLEKFCEIYPFYSLVYIKGCLKHLLSSNVDWIKIYKRVWYVRRDDCLQYFFKEIKNENPAYVKIKNKFMTIYNRAINNE